MNDLSAPELDSLAQLFRCSLHLADDLGAATVGISLNSALFALTGEGVSPRT